MGGGNTSIIKVINYLVGKTNKLFGKSGKKTRLDLVSEKNLLVEKAATREPLSDKTRKEIIGWEAGVSSLAAGMNMALLEMKVNELALILKKAAEENPNLCGGGEGAAPILDCKRDSEGGRNWVSLTIGIDDNNPALSTKRDIVHYESMKFELAGGAAGMPRILLNSTIMIEYAELRGHGETLCEISPGNSNDAAEHLIKAAERLGGYDPKDRWVNNTPVKPERAEALLMYCHDAVHQVFRSHAADLKTAFGNIIGELEKIDQEGKGKFEAYEQDNKYPGIICSTPGNEVRLYADTAARKIVAVENGEKAEEINAGDFSLYYDNGYRLNKMLMKVAEAIVPK